MGRILVKHSSGDIWIRPYCPRDAIAAAELEFDQFVKHFLDGPPQQDREVWIQRFNADQLNADGFLAVGMGIDDRLVGRVGMVRLDEFPNCRELSIVLARSLVGRGLGRLLAAGLISHAFQDPTVEAVRAAIDPDHDASRALLAALGFQSALPGNVDFVYEREAFTLARSDWGAGPDQ